jgi:peroxiredoxin
VDLTQLPADLPQPVDDGAARHLVGLALPSVQLPATTGELIDLARCGSIWTVVYAYPLTGRPGESLPGGWNLIPGARGCTPEACGFRDHYGELVEAGASVFGLSTQAIDYQRELIHRLHLPFPILSDADLILTSALQLPTFQVEGLTLLKRFTLILRLGKIEHVFYPVFPPDRHAKEVVEWLRPRARAEAAV